MKSANWDRVTRWAKMGNNESDPANRGDGDDRMQDGMQDEQAAVVDRVEAGVSAEGENEEMGPQSESPAEIELAQVKADREQVKDRLMRLQAEFDNARKRAEKERTDAREYSIGNTVEPFLSVMDNFRLALGADGSVEQLRSGVGLILKQMEEALRGLNVVPVETVGTQFDPRVHEALGSIETAEHPDHQVLEEIRKGYKLRDKLLRPALVRIAVNSAQMSD
jgi:molecular chaperone GrpE